jgi:hypothetical protein
VLLKTLSKWNERNEAVFQSTINGPDQNLNNNPQTGMSTAYRISNAVGYGPLLKIHVSNAGRAQQPCLVQLTKLDRPKYNGQLNATISSGPKITLQ